VTPNRRVTTGRPYDREIARLAVPALGALAAEPLYLLADTAIVGHLGTRPLAGLAVAGSVLTAAFSVFNFLAYSTTAGVARQLGAGHRREAAQSGVDGCWLAIGLGLVLTVLGLAFAPAIADVMGASTTVAPFAVTYLRISIVGAPALLLALAGAGYLRGMQDTKTTLVIAVVANAANLLIELLFVYGLDLGIAGSAWGTVVAQYGAAIAYVVIVARAVGRADASIRPRAAGVRANATVGSRLVVRTASLIVALLTATAIASRISDDAVAAHQICMQILLFLALSLDALAIAGQAMVGRFLGASSAHDARSVGRRLIELGVIVGVLFGLAVVVLRPWLADAFTNDAGVRHLVLEVLWIVAALQPVAAVVFVLDGVLIGAGDAGYLALAMLVATVGVYLPAALAVAVFDGGLLWLWGALALWMLARFVGMAGRFRTPRWEVVGATR
jgi:putative MATE family efflux protein